MSSVTRLDVSQQGTLESTTTATDLAISGNGFFVVSNAGGQQFLTRSGSFVPDASGNLVNAAGYYLNGYSLANGAPTIASNSLTGMQVVNVNGNRPVGDGHDQRNPDRQSPFDRQCGGRRQSALGQQRQLDL